MKVKELERFCCTAWSPASCDRICMAAVTAEEEDSDSAMIAADTQLAPTLELFQLNLQDPSLDMQPTLTVEVKHRSTSLCWTSPTSGAEFGLLICGTALGGLTLYNPDQLFVTVTGEQQSNDTGCSSSFVYADRERVHTGVVRDLDSNRFQVNLFASVADEAEILIWDVEKMDQPMSPGNKVQVSTAFYRVPANCS
ncbi:uncharacterized protein DEA37_0007155 [Paragonimus westermani]|uniref:Uncharacterized protein n=1 Tax=Paragonimus westermani TaxID=34504 RepID=A0A5J4NUG5_9TREM|nr:uncharacterized protein DEA37_0007155 [Paragonimus westermani]